MQRRDFHEINDVFALLVVALLAFTGCVTTGPGGTDFPRHEALLRATVVVATVIALGEKPAYAQTVYAIATEVGNALDNQEITTLAHVEKSVRGLIDFAALDAGDALVVELLITTIRTELDQYIARQNISAPAAVQVQLRAVLRWIAEAAWVRIPA